MFNSVNDVTERFSSCSTTPFNSGIGFMDTYGMHGAEAEAAVVAKYPNVAAVIQATYIGPQPLRGAERLHLHLHRLLLKSLHRSTGRPLRIQTNPACCPFIGGLMKELRRMFNRLATAVVGSPNGPNK